MRRKTIILLATIGALVLGVVFASPRISFYLLTRHFSPIEKIESLHNPVAVTKRNLDGLSLADGRTVQLPGLHSLPINSAALSEATKRGVEVHADGRVWGLVKVHHWCGNDPVRVHIARVDLSDMLTFLRVGEPISTVPEVEYLAREPGGKFTQWGWNISEFYQFHAWQRLKDSGR